MNAQDVSRLVTELCLSESRALTEELRPFAPRAASSAAAGQLADALRDLGYDDQRVSLGVAWPTALRRASALLDQLPTPSVIRVPLAQATVWFGFISLVQMVVLAVLSAKVLPVIAQLARDNNAAPGLSSLLTGALLEVAGPLLGVSVLALLALSLLGAIGPAWLPGWGRHLRRAREAVATAALIEAQAAPEVLSNWLRQSKTLRVLGSGPIAEDLLALGAASALRAEHAMRRFVIAYRYFGYALLTTVACGITLGVYYTCSTLGTLR